MLAALVPPILLTQPAVAIAKSRKKKDESLGEYKQGKTIVVFHIPFADDVSKVFRLLNFLNNITSFA